MFFDICDNVMIGYEFKINDYGEVEERNFPLCKCEKPGEVRPNILLYNDSQWNTTLSDK